MIYMKFKAGGFYKGSKDNGPEAATRKKENIILLTGWLCMGYGKKTVTIWECWTRKSIFRANQLLLE